MKKTLIQSVCLFTLFSVSGVVIAQQPPSDVPEKSAIYLESLRISDKQKKESLTVKETNKKEGAAKQPDTAVAKSENDQVKPKQSKKVSTASKGNAGSKPAIMVAEKDTKAYVASQQAESLIAVYPELTAIYSKGGVYFVVLKLGSRTITAQDGESTICGVVKVLNLNSAKVGNQVLNVN